MRRVFDVGAGLLAAAAMAVTPVAVAVSRTNNLDSLLVLTLLLAAWAVVRAAETGRLRWPLLSALLVGLGFNIKMLQAYLVVPAFGLLYLLAAPVGLRQRVGQLALAFVVLAAVSLSWAVAVDLTPPDQRPYVGSSRSNSALDLALGYNGLQRLLGRQFGGGGGGRPAGAPPTGLAGGATAPGGFSGAGELQPPGQTGAVGVQPAQQTDTDGAQNQVPDDRFGGPGNGPAGMPRGGGPGGGGENGAKGWLRLFNQQLAGQIAWLLPLALVGLVAAWPGRPNFSKDRRQQAVVLWGTWLLTGAAFFSVVGFYHRYYLIMLGPPVAALAAAAVTALWQRYRAGGWQAFLLPGALLVTAAVQWHILGDYPAWRDRLTPVLAGGSALVVIVLVAARFSGRMRAWLRPALMAGLGAAALLAAPAAWAAVTVWDGTNTTLPAAGPSAQRPGGGSGGGFPGGPGDGGGMRGGDIDASLLAYLQANRGGARYLVATPSAGTAGPIIIATGEPVMAMGGFSGGDPILTADEIAAKVAAGEVRFFLLGGGPGGGQNGAADWVTQNCAAVPASTWQGSASTQTGTVTGSSSTNQARAFDGGQQLYDCAPAR